MLGSLSTVGEVYLNGAVAPPESEIFTGDLLRSAGTGGATFTLSGKGSLQIYPNSEIVFTGEPQYAAELKLGRLVMNSATGATGISLRAGSSVVVPVAEGQRSASSIEAPSDGSFLVKCIDGSVGVISLAGGKGIFIQAGQSVGISGQGELSALSPQAAPAPSATPTSTETSPAARQKRNYRRWILIALGTAGVGTAAAILSASSSRATANTASLSSTPASSSPSSSSPTSSNASPPNNPPAPDPVPAPLPPTPQPPNAQPSPPGDDCHHHKHQHDDNCKPQVVLHLAFHF